MKDDGGVAGTGIDTDPSANTITINVTADNDGPTAVDDPTNPVVEDTTTLIDPLINDTDPENDRCS